MHDRARSRVREQRTDHRRRDAPQRAEPDASRTRRRDPSSEIPRTLRGIVIPVRMSLSGFGDRASGREVVRAHERPAREAVPPHGSDDVPLAARQLEIEVNARIGRLVDEEAQRVVERRRLGHRSLRTSARRRARRRDGRGRRTRRGRRRPPPQPGTSSACSQGASVAAPLCPMRSGRPSRRSMEITASASSAGSPPRAGRPGPRTRRSSGQ